MTGVLGGFAALAAVIAVGWIVGPAGILGAPAEGVLSRLSFFVASPALLFLTLAEADTGAVFSAALIGTAGSALLAALLYAGLAWWRWRLPAAQLTTGGLASSYVNAGTLGIPVVGVRARRRLLRRSGAALPGAGHGPGGARRAGRFPGCRRSPDEQVAAADPAGPDAGGHRLRAGPAVRGGRGRAAAASPRAGRAPRRAGHPRGAAGLRHEPARGVPACGRASGPGRSGWRSP